MQQECAAVPTHGLPVSSLQRRRRGRRRSKKSRRCLTGGCGSFSNSRMSRGSSTSTMPRKSPLHCRQNSRWPTGCWCTAHTGVPLTAAITHVVFRCMRYSDGIFAHLFICYLHAYYLNPHCRDGISMATMYRKCYEYGGACVILVKDDEKHVCAVTIATGLEYTCLKPTHHGAGLWRLCDGSAALDGREACWDRRMLPLQDAAVCRQHQWEWVNGFFIYSWHGPSREQECTRALNAFFHFDAGSLSCTSGRRRTATS